VPRQLPDILPSDLLSRLHQRLVRLLGFHSRHDILQGKLLEKFHLTALVIRPLLFSFLPTAISFRLIDFSLHFDLLCLFSVIYCFAIAAVVQSLTRSPSPLKTPHRKSVTGQSTSTIHSKYGRVIFSEPLFYYMLRVIRSECSCVLFMGSIQFWVMLRKKALPEVLIAQLTFKGI
jgi:hypothetical protein